VPPPPPDDRSGRRPTRRRPSDTAVRLLEVIDDEGRGRRLGELGRAFEAGESQRAAELVEIRRTAEEAVATNLEMQAERHTMLADMDDLHARLHEMALVLAAAEADRDAALAELYEADPAARGRWVARAKTTGEFERLRRASERPKG
ncbi:MAG: hypothetical protein AAF447_22695, partial [Myxococcota bacterium]